ncbi:MULTISPECIES: DUF1573 domain-containing protein [unclassified Apibacter]|uniref:DUF1573 domain-containing protein n=1 Tax=unclassified Apibacter TaxID=2630820 RepID=UPI00135ED4B8|nr:MULTISPECIES: DUF1573 domain-containing protein [unclassified Apibacter]MXP05172.1 DUF1573 domain-containing protein [Apibacter sp. B3546]MXP11571.1 DUF1573 domain-containing protein [Apibacter sp. B3239]QII71895.1 DUF1573 domain-containing protein [Apibacter sp. B2966]QYN49260.1 DUF1573 domain-containing protein [Apibacter sp. ESL0432]
MKKFVLSSAFLLGAFIFSNAQEIKITNYENNTVDYGNVNKGSNGKRIIKIQNVGDKPLIISNINTSCGCTVPQWTTEPIAPGKKGEITVTYNTSNVGRFSRTITISSNDEKKPNLPVRIEGVVLAPETNPGTDK